LFLQVECLQVIQKRSGLTVSICQATPGHHVVAKVKLFSCFVKVILGKSDSIFDVHALVTFPWRGALANCVHELIKLLNGFVAVDADLHKVIEGCVVFFLKHVEVSLVGKIVNPFHVFCKTQHWLTPCRTCSKISNVLKMVNVPVCQADTLFDIIEGDVCKWILLGVNKYNNLRGKVLDAPDVVCDGHDLGLLLMAATIPITSIQPQRRK